MDVPEEAQGRQVSLPQRSTTMLKIDEVDRRKLTMETEEFFSDVRNVSGVDDGSIAAAIDLEIERKDAPGI